MISIQNINLENEIANIQPNNLNQPIPKTKIYVLDTAFFINQKPLNLAEGFKYFTTEFIVKEIKDEKAREYFNLNKEFIGIRNPSRDVMKLISNFAKLSNDLKALSIPDLSIVSLAYELAKEEGHESLLRKEPLKYDVVDIVESNANKFKKGEEEEIYTETTNEAKTSSNVIEDDGFVEVKTKHKSKNVENESSLLKNWGDEEWITADNINEKLHILGKVSKTERQEEKSPITVTIFSSDFTVQNLALKIGIPIMSLDNMLINKIKHYILKCYSCSNFIFDTSKLFCENCGYNTLMKIGCSINKNGRMRVYDKKAETRLRGTQFDLPKPSLTKKGVIYILAEDQLPKKRFNYNLEKDLDRILDNYESGRDFNPIKNDIKNQNTTKSFVWGFPKKNPNVAKKYYSKKTKK